MQTIYPTRSRVTVFDGRSRGVTLWFRSLELFFIRNEFVLEVLFRLVVVGGVF
jgi:hypothetical protein